jgi:hypothetical protein
VQLAEMRSCGDDAAREECEPLHIALGDRGLVIQDGPPRAFVV